MILQIIVEGNSDSTFNGRLLTIDFNGYEINSIHLEGVGFLVETFPKEWRFSINSSAWLEFGSSDYVLTGRMQRDYIPINGAV